MDKNQAVIDFLLTCPSIVDSPLYFNLINAKDNNKQIITTGNDRNAHRPFVDGSVLKQYTFTLIDFKSMMQNALVLDPGYPDENVVEMAEVQDIIDWLNDQADARNFPDFGADCSIEEMVALTDNPNLNGIDSSVTPVLAKYSISIRITYLDNSKKIWNT